MKSKSNSKPTAQNFPLAGLDDATPRVALTFTNETIHLTRFDPRGAPVATYPVRSGDVANAFKQFGASTGLLPLDALFWQSLNNVLRIGIWLPPTVRALTFAQGKRDVTLNVPLPGFVFVGKGGEYYIYAALERPTNAHARLFRAPLPNVNDNGMVCAGNVKFPRANAETMPQAVALFFESHFNSDLSANKIASQANQAEDDEEEEEGDLWYDEDQEYAPGMRGEMGQEDPEDPYEMAHGAARARRAEGNLYQFLCDLEGEREFPARELVYACTLKDVMEEK